MSRRSDQPGTFELLAKLPHQIIQLVKLEIANAKREVTAKAKRLGIGAVAVVVALFFVFFALEALVVAAIAGVAVVWPVWLSALVVAVGLLVLAGLAIFAGIMLMKKNVPVPSETLHRFEDDAKAMSEVRINAEDTPAAAGGSELPRVGEKGNWR
ncbi:hypothetical protein GCM10009847_03990 [Leucobacter tardus]|uniref:Phage holin family protein n=1 Tax=Leucobacter tardus TaxID=501483 RepID=A0A939QBB2_9MICO|nr:phage holin family protein [Leucobacter tardus]MBO2988606.1 phage holin family protein [Leucobacter tardus]